MSKKTSSRRTAVRKVAKEVSRKTGTSSKVVESAIRKQIITANENKSLGYLSYAGILPVDLPDGTRVIVLPDIHVPAHNKLVMWAVKAFLKDYQPHILIFIGDVATFLRCRAGASRLVSRQICKMSWTRHVVSLTS